MALLLSSAVTTGSFGTGCGSHYFDDRVIEAGWPLYAMVASAIGAGVGCRGRGCSDITIERVRIQKACELIAAGKGWSKQRSWEHSN